MKVDCKHKWIDMEDGSFDQFCVRCSLKQMQNVMMPLGAEISASIAQSIARERIEVPFYNGSEHTRISVYKDDLIKRMSKELGVPGALLNGARR